MFSKEREFLKGTDLGVISLPLNGTNLRRKRRMFGICNIKHHRVNDKNFLGISHFIVMFKKIIRLFVFSLKEFLSKKWMRRN